MVIQLQMLPTPVQTEKLLETIRLVNGAATFAAQCGFSAGAFTQANIHRLAYFAIREKFSLPAQLAVRAIGKAVKCFSRDKKSCPTFRHDGAISYDQRNLSFKGAENVSLSTISGREVVKIAYGEYQSRRLGMMAGQSSLVHRNGKFFLMATIDVPEPSPSEVESYLGVDVGISNIATDSEGESFDGKGVERNRQRREAARKQYQRRGTKSSKRRLKKMRGRQARFQRQTNHVISKKIVAKAKALGTGIAMEDLKGIRSRIKTTVSSEFRRRLGNWGFFQLRKFVEYKARLAGVPVVFVNPRNTSRTCSSCGHCEKGNRKSQSEFNCKKCKHSEHADFNAALNIGRLGQCKLATKVSV